MNRKMIVIVALSFLLVLLLGMSYAYSKYKSDVTGTATLDIANWHITVNDCDIVVSGSFIINSSDFQEKINSLR